MSEPAIIAVLFGAGLLVLVAELFIPSHGILTVVGVGLLAAGVVETFRYAGQKGGAIAILGCLVVLPAFALVAIKVWPRTWVGRRIAPPNPVATPEDSSIPVAEISRYIGQCGRSLTPLRPVGICEFNGRRVSCVAEFGMLDAGATVEGLRVSGANLAVQEKKT